MDSLQKITKALVTFRNERNWKQFHNPKDLALALSIEAAELNELFLWKRDEKEWKDIPLEKLKEELADVFAYAFLLAEKFDFNVENIVKEKIVKNSEKYPIDKSYNKSTKYNDL